MRALAYDAPGGPVTVRELPDPVAPAGGVVVAVEATGLCRSDWHAWVGHDPDVARFPHVPGHEFAGRVDDVGEGVDLAWLGRRVTAPFVYACGRCDVCAAGDGQVCPHQSQPGFTLPGSFAERVVVTAAETNLVALPDHLDAALAASLGCRVATAYRALVGRARVAPGEWVAVFGCGGVGLAATAIAVARGARVVAVDVSPAALAAAERLGAEALVPAGDAAVAAVVATTGGGAHVAIDALGAAATCEASILSLRRRGRQVQVGLVLGDERPQVPVARVIAWELDLLGSHGMAAAGYRPLLADVAAGRLPLASLLAAGDPLGLADGGRALAAMGERREPGIALIDPRR